MCQALHLYSRHCMCIGVLRIPRLIALQTAVMIPFDRLKQLKSSEVRQLVHRVRDSYQAQDPALPCGARLPGWNPCVFCGEGRMMIAPVSWGACEDEWVHTDVTAPSLCPTTDEGDFLPPITQALYQKEVRARRHRAEASST